MTAYSLLKQKIDILSFPWKLVLFHSQWFKEGWYLTFVVFMWAAQRDHTPMQIIKWVFIWKLAKGTRLPTVNRLPVKDPESRGVMIYTSHDQACQCISAECTTSGSR